MKPLHRMIVIGIIVETVVLVCVGFWSGNFGFCNTLYAGEALKTDIGTYLSTVLKDPSISTRIEENNIWNNDRNDSGSTSLGFSGGSRLMSEYIDDPELRVSIDRFEADQQKFAFRFKPKSPTVVEKENVLHRTLMKNDDVTLTCLIHQALKQRYMNIVNLFHLSEMIRLREALKVLLTDRETVLKHHVETSMFDVAELSDTEKELIDIEMTLMSLTTQLSGLKDQISYHLANGTLSKPNAGNLQNDEGVLKELIELSNSRNQLIRIESIADKTSNISQLYSTAEEKTVHHSGDASGEISHSNDISIPENNNVQLLKAGSEADIAKAKYHLASAESGKLITFVETAYDTSDRDDFEDAFSIEFGISIPFGNSKSKRDLLERKAAGIKAENAYRMLNQQINQTVPVRIKELQQLIQYHNTVKAKKDQGFTSTTFDRLLETEGTNPITLLKFKENMLKTDILLEKLHGMIFIKYVEILDITGKLSALPLKNHLAPHMEPLDVHTPS